ncbi:pheromone A receptor-domain-containing protein [Xylaria bambusicola]|uniref:pheromone A receptor-domain-containing protein n=1 Tax=Xylaria bambusicola TaxID=326684 RepID=UPI0020082D10|nr:pheromone A receptor-domain-containing protein [Xylaria bambusicola]KAI0527948.1 pheromone A receptor-domain-containing protein [Xylaria bambusicola]
MTQASETNHGLLANLIARVILAFVGMLLCWVPVRLLVRNGEFAAVVLIIDVTIMNTFTILNALIWHDDNWTTWWDGTGLCDVEVYLSGPLQTIYAASIFTVMYHLAQQVKVTGARRDRSLRTRRNLIQAAIIFPIPAIQLAFTYFDLAQRYIIGTLIGCSAVYDTSWPKTLVYDVPPAVFAVLSVPYAILLWKRYHVITKQTKGILKSNSQASIRASRTRLRLYNMSLSILVIYLPVMIYFLVCNVQDTLSSDHSYDFNRMRWSATPYPWDTILFVPSWIIPSFVMNQPWIPIATAAAIVAFFGMTIEARKVYRQYAEYAGLGLCVRRFRPRSGQGHNSVDESGGSRESRKTLLPNCVQDCTGDQRGQSSIIPTIEHPDNARIPKLPASSNLLGQLPITTLKTPPIIPPRFSSLRPSFTFRTPTLQSIRRTIRFASALSAYRSHGTSSASNATTGNLTESDHTNSIPMLPLPSVRAVRASFLVTSPSMDFWAESAARIPRPVSRFEMRTPTSAHQRSASGRYSDEWQINSSGRGAQRDSFPREVTLTSIYTTTSGTHTNMSHSSSGPDGVGIAS